MTAPPHHLKNEDRDGPARQCLRDAGRRNSIRRDFTINALAYNIADFSGNRLHRWLERPPAAAHPAHRRSVRPLSRKTPVRMIRAVRFAASHDLTIEPATWETICEISSTITRAAPARLYEEMLKIFLLGSARPVFTLMERSGLLPALFPGLGRWLSGSGDGLAVLNTNLDCLDRLYRGGLPPSAPLFLSAYSARAWKRRRLPATATASPTSRRSMPRAPFSWRPLQNRLHPGPDRRSTAPHPRLSALATPHAAAASRCHGRQARVRGRHGVPLSHGQDTERKSLLCGMVGDLCIKNPPAAGVELTPQEAPAKRRRRRGAETPPEIATECRLFPTTRTLKK